MSKYLEVAQQYINPANPFSNKMNQTRSTVTKQVSKMSETFTSDISKAEVPVIERLQENMQKEDPLLKNKFSFYNSAITLNLDDRVQILKDDVINYYRGRLVQLEEYTGLLESESHFFKERSQKYHGKLIVCKEKIKELHQRIRHHITNHQRERLEELRAEREKYKQLKAESEATIKQCK